MSSDPAADDAAKGAKRRSGIPTLRAPATTPTARPPLPQQADVQRLAAEDSGRDSGLSSECTTPTNDGSPPPRQVKPESQPTQIPRRKMVDIIAASKARLQESARLNSNNRTTRLLNSRSSSESPRSLDSRRTQVFSPLRTPRNIQSPSLDSGDEGSLRIERGAYNYMFQDIVSIKTMLLKLKRVLQEPGENGLTRSETLNPFDNTLKNGLFFNLNDGNTATDASLSDGREAAAAAIADELADLRRQVVFLQGQVDDKDRTINSLQAQLAKYQSGKADLLPTSNAGDEEKETCNAATQTDKLRPVSTSSSILQPLSQDNEVGSLVSWNDSWSSQQSPKSQRTGSNAGHSEQGSLQNSLSNGKLTTPSSTSSSRRSSSDSSPQPAPRPNSLRGLKPPNGFTPSPPGSPKTRSAIPTPRSRLATPTLIPRAARAVSATGRAHNT